MVISHEFQDKEIDSYFSFHL